MSKDGAVVTWQCDKTLEEVQQYAEQQLEENDVTKDDDGIDSDNEDDSTLEQDAEEELCAGRSSKTAQEDISDEGSV